MATWFIIVIYLAFISLGLPDSVLGAAWPTMYKDLNVELSSAGMISIVVSIGTIISSLNSGRLIKLLGTGKLTLISCILTSGALFGFSQSQSIFWLVLLAIPLGLGAGAVDSGLNHFVAENYKVHHMNWLHAFWGVGATVGPIIMSFFLIYESSWRMGYGAISGIQFLLVILLFITLPMWDKVKKHNSNNSKDENQNENKTNSNPAKNVLKIPGVKYTLLSFFFYCSAEMTVGLWGASYLNENRGMSPEAAAGWISLYFGGITIGRILTGFASMRIKNRSLLLMGQLISLFGVILILLPLPVISAQIGLVLTGLGFAPVFPGLIHETPKRFGKANSPKLIGLQMASAYTGITIMPPLFGLIASKINIGLFPIIVLIFVVILTFSSERIVSIVSKKTN